MSRYILNIVLIVFAFINTACISSSLENDPKYKEMQQMYSTLPLYPGSEEVHSGGGSKGFLAYVSRYYRASLSYDQLKQFYLEKMQGSGWKLADEKKSSTSWFGDDGGKELEFIKGDYKVSVEHATKERNIGWDYAIMFEWRAP